MKSPMTKPDQAAAAHPLASKTGLALVLGILVRDGDMCPKCGHGTRVTSKRWARCKKCGERCRRGPGDKPQGGTP
jgi:uncharacterized protein (DUF983 family)